MTEMNHLFSIDPYAPHPSLVYEGSDIAYQRFIGPGRPEGEGHVHLVPQVKYTPVPIVYGETVLVQIRGPLAGQSRSGLSLYGCGRVDVEKPPGAVGDRLMLAPMHDDDRRHRVIKIGGGWLLYIHSPHVVTWERPTGRCTEGHCAERRCYRPKDAIAIWGNACKATALCGELFDVPADANSNYIGLEAAPPVWLPTRRERFYLAQEKGGEIQELVWDLERKLAQPAAYDIDPKALIPPWAEPAPQDMPYLRAITARYLGEERAEKYFGPSSGSEIDEAMDDDPERIFVAFCNALKGGARWTDRAEWERLEDHE